MLLWAYCRVSTLKEAQELSIEEQQRWASEHAAKEGSALRVFVERASAKTTIGRPIFQGMIAELQALQAARRPKQILVTSFDRLSRDMTDTLIVVRALREMKVGLYVRDAGGIVKAETFADRAAIVGQSMGGEAENEARSSRMKRSFERRKREGKSTSNKAPFGIQLRAERDTANGEAAEWVLRAFQWYESGEGTVTIARRFAAGAPDHVVESVTIDPATGRPKMLVRKNVWEPVRIGRLLAQERYRGLIVPEDLFDRVQQIRAAKPRWRSDRHFEFMLSGVLRCPTCPRALSGRATGGSRNRWTRKDGTRVYGNPRATRTRYYFCKVCNAQYNADRMETQFRKEIDELVSDSDALRRWVTGERERGDQKFLRREMDRLETETKAEVVEAARKRAWELAMAASISADDLGAQLRRMDEDVLAKRQRIEEIRALLGRRQDAERNYRRSKEMLSNFWRLYEAADYEERRTLLARLIAITGPVYASRDGLKMDYTA